jgi:hypothetical protein
MSNLWIFGDNSSSIFGKTSERRYYYYEKYRRGNFPKTWSELLSDELGLDLKNYAIEGQSNYDIFEWFCKLSTSIKKGDVVIIGWSSVSNFRLVNQYDGKFITIRPDALSIVDKPEFLKGITLETINSLHRNRNNKKWSIEISNWENVINLLSSTIGFDIYYWTFDTRIQRSFYIGGDKHNFYHHLKEIGAETINEESRGELDDNHFGEIGHKVQFEYFLKHLHDNNTNR